jgi:hypothetical protein
MWSVRTVVSWRPDEDRAQSSKQDLLESGRARPASGRRLRLIVRTRETSLLISEAARVRTALIHRLDGDPTEAIYGADCRIPSHTPQNLFFGIV